MAKVFTTIVPLAAAGAGDFFDFRPPVGEDWEVTGLTADVFSGGTVPNVDAGLINAAGIISWLRHSGNTGTFENLLGWAGRTSIFINNAVWLRVENADAAPVIVGITARLVKKYGLGQTSSVVSGLVTGAAPVPVQPPLGEDWVLTHVGSSVWDGANPNQIPNVHVDITEGANIATIANNTIASRGWDNPMNLHINNAVFATITPAAAATVCWSAYKRKTYGPNIAFSDVISTAQVTPVATILDFQPPPGEAWLITNIGCSAAFTAGVPTVLVNLMDAAGQVTIAQLATANKGWFDEMAYYINNTNWLRTTAVAADIVGISGIKMRDN